MPTWVRQLTLTEWFGYTGLIPFIASGGRWWLGWRTA